MLLVELHNKHGPIIQMAPNELDANHTDVIGLYKQGRTALKSGFYTGSLHSRRISSAPGMRTPVAHLSDSLARL